MVGIFLHQPRTTRSSHLRYGASWLLPYFPSRDAVRSGVGCNGKLLSGFFTVGWCSAKGLLGDSQTVARRWRSSVQPKGVKKVAVYDEKKSGEGSRWHGNSSFVRKMLESWSGQGLEKKGKDSELTRQHKSVGSNELVEYQEGWSTKI
ncbi:hypothetical protein E3N88_29439 [Mikania micrantha]|uniref:Uncharacterized protein n=1 Tax=Mikania micrantha TaxID=192012 RepID=A0A5N6MJG7_9ASTR|nr:hypothetical protein E3N88_29439 [Mikania micrantha]